MTGRAEPTGRELMLKASRGGAGDLPLKVLDLQAMRGDFLSQTSASHLLLKLLQSLALLQQFILELRLTKQFPDTFPDLLSLAQALQKTADDATAGAGSYALLFVPIFGA